MALATPGKTAFKKIRCARRAGTSAVYGLHGGTARFPAKAVLPRRDGRPPAPALLVRLLHNCPGMLESPFKTMWMAGFECSCHRRPDGRRLDLAVASGHERWAVLDYERLRALGIATVREGIAWHRCERPDGRIDLSPLRPRLAAARDAGMQVIWDLCHYGWPDGLDIFRPAFVDRFAAWARAVAELVAEESDGIPLYVPVNEISFWSWAGGEVGFMNPCTEGRGFELKAQLVRAALAATEALREVDPRARVLYVDPIIHIEADPARPEERADARGHRLAQWEAGYADELGRREIHRPLQDPLVVGVVVDADEVQVALVAAELRPAPAGEHQALAEATPDVHFVGRLATYKYYNMDQVVAQALSVYARMTGRKRAESTRATAPTLTVPLKERPAVTVGAAANEAKLARGA